jgi:PAS domain S-box-containing protein
LNGPDRVTWETLYHSALLELDPQELLGRILAAETACQEREESLGTGTEQTSELEAIAVAKRNLQVLRKQLITPALHNEASHTHPELNGECVAFVNANRQYVAVTDGVCNLLRYSRAELIGKTIDEVAAPEMVDTVPAQFEKYVREGFLGGEFVLLRSDGRRMPIRYEAKVFPDGCLVAQWWRADEQSSDAE